MGGLFARADIEILMIGLDAAGKTTILYSLKVAGEIVTTPTYAGYMETVKYKNINFTVWDVGGQDKIRAIGFYSPSPYEKIEGVIFVVDSNDRERIDLAALELQKVLTKDELRDASLLVLCNKQDLPNVMSVAEVTDKLGLHSITNRQWHIQATCACLGDGIWEGLDWISQARK